MIKDFGIKLEILSEALGKKEEALNQILAITENQATVLESIDETDQWRSFIAAMNEEKQKHIDIVLNSDEVFEGIFREFGGDFEEYAPRYKETVHKLQEQIKAVTDLDIRIRVYEDKNKNAAGNKTDAKVKINVPKASKSYILKQYTSNNRKY